MLLIALGTSGIGYGVFDKFWLPYKKIQESKSQEFILEMKKLRAGINRVEYEVRLNTLVTSGEKLTDAISILEKNRE